MYKQDLFASMLSLEVTTGLGASYLSVALKKTNKQKKTPKNEKKMHRLKMLFVFLALKHV